MQLNLSTFMQQSQLASIPAKLKAYQQLVGQFGESHDPTKALIEITLNVPDDFNLGDYGLEVKEPDEVNELVGDALTPDELALIDAACAEYAQLPVEVRSVLKAIDLPSTGKPGAATHSAKWDRCIEHVKANSPDVNAYAVCTASLGEGATRSVSRVAMELMAKALQSKSTPHTESSIEHPDLIARGGSLKALPDGWVYGCAVLFTDPSRKDLTGDYFTKSTELAWQGLEPRIALYHHGMDNTFKDTEFKNGWQLDHIDDIGLWVKHQCDLRDEYEAAVYGMVKAKKLGLSSGAASHLVKRANDGQLLRWPISEISYTPTPAEPGTMVQAIKSLEQVKTFAELSGIKTEKPKPVKSKPIDDSRLAQALALTTLTEQDQRRVLKAVELITTSSVKYNPIAAKPIMNALNRWRKLIPGKKVRLEELAAATNLPKYVVQSALVDLVADGQVRDFGDGTYESNEIA